MKKILFFLALLGNCALLNAKKINVIKRSRGLEAFITASGESEDMDELDQLLSKVTNIDNGTPLAGFIYKNEELEDLKGVNALMNAVAQENLEAVKFLIKKGADPNAQANPPPKERKFYNGFTPLAFAVHSRNVEIVKKLAPVTNLALKYRGETIRDKVYRLSLGSKVASSDLQDEFGDILEIIDIALNNLKDKFKTKLIEIKKSFDNILPDDTMVELVEEWLTEMKNQLN